jgi:hypothetical protein
MTYADAVQSWHDFYMTAGAAAATLVGLLFVGLSLHIRVVVAQADVKSLARITLADFFVILLVALVILAPVGDAWSDRGMAIGGRGGKRCSGGASRRRGLQEEPPPDHRTSGVALEVRPQHPLLPGCGDHGRALRSG